MEMTGRSEMKMLKGNKKWTENQNSLSTHGGVKWARTIDLYDVNVTL